MKKIYLGGTIIIIFIILFLLSATKSFPEKLSVNNEYCKLNDTCEITTSNKAIRVSWIVGDSGQVVMIENGHIAKQLTLLNGEYNFIIVSFANMNCGWIVGIMRDNPDKRQGVIAKTKDGGKNWYFYYPKVLPGLQSSFLKVQAVSLNHVWIICDNDYILRTIDGGINWSITYSKK